MTHDPFVTLSAPPPIWAVQSNGYSADPEPESIIPCNIEAERAVLGSILLDSEALFVVAKILKPGDFFREPHQWLYQIMLDLSEANKAIDFVTIIDALEKKKLLSEVGGPAFVTGLISTTASSMYAEHYAQIVYEDAVRRRMIAASGKIAELAYDRSVDLPALLSKADREVSGLGSSTGKQDEPIRSVVDNVLAQIDFMSQNKGAIIGVPTGFTQLDRMMGGLQKSDLIILAGRPGMGKTSFALSVAQNAAKRCGAKVAIFSLEMSNEQLVQRWLAMESGIDSQRVRLGNIEDSEWDLLLEAANQLTKTDVMIQDNPGASAYEIRSQCRNLQRAKGLDLVIIDYIQLMAGANSSGRNENRQQEISQISRALKLMARELNVPVMVLSSMSRAVEARSDKRPQMSDLKESSSIESDADVVLFIYRDDYYNEGSDKPNIADVIIAKQRHGPTGTISLYFRKELTQFRDLEIERTELSY